MATLVLSESVDMKHQTVRSTKRIEWVKVVASTSTTGDGAAYSFTKVKSVVGVIGAGPFAVVIDNSAKTATITPVATVSGGNYFIGLVEG